MKLAEAVNPPVPTLGGHVSSLARLLRELQGLRGHNSAGASVNRRPGRTGTTKAAQNQVHRVMAAVIGV